MGAGASTVPNAGVAQEEMQAAPAGTSPADDKRASAGLVYDEIIGKRTHVSWRAYKDVRLRVPWRSNMRALEVLVRAIPLTPPPSTTQIASAALDGTEENHTLPAKQLLAELDELMASGGHSSDEPVGRDDFVELHLRLGDELTAESFRHYGTLLILSCNQTGDSIACAHEELLRSRERGGDEASEDEPSEDDMDTS